MLLLDTCTLLWLMRGGESLSRAARDAITASGARLFVSGITAFEVGVKHHRGALMSALTPLAWFERALAFHDVELIRAYPKTQTRW
jgi:PIN domain nuclease of toxin-antitoxin system